MREEERQEVETGEKSRRSVIAPFHSLERKERKILCIFSLNAGIQRKAESKKSAIRVVLSLNWRGLGGYCLFDP